jgi:hypothetical protein
MTLEHRGAAKRPCPCHYCKGGDGYNCSYRRTA